MEHNMRIQKTTYAILACIGVYICTHAQDALIEINRISNDTNTTFWIETPYDTLCVSPHTQHDIPPFILDENGCNIYEHEGHTLRWHLAHNVSTYTEHNRGLIGYAVQYGIQDRKVTQDPMYIPLTLSGSNTISITQHKHVDTCKLISSSLETELVCKKAYEYTHNKSSNSTPKHVDLIDLSPITRQGKRIRTSHMTNELQPNNTLERPFDIYLPPEYDENPSQHFPVLYYLHGFPANQENSSQTISFIADILINAGRIQPMVIVFPNGNAPVDSFAGVNVPSESSPITETGFVVDGNEIHTVYVDSDPAQGGIGRWQTYLVNDLIPYVENTFRVKTDVQNRGITGFSMGGGAHRVALPRSNIFGSLSTSSGAFLDFSKDFQVFEKLDDIAIDLQNENGETPKHLAEFIDPNNPTSSNIRTDVIGLLSQIAIIHNISRALSPDINNNFQVQFPLDAAGNVRDGTSGTDDIFSLWNQHSAPEIADNNANDIINNGMKIYFNAGGLDFFYDLAFLNFSPVRLERRLSDFEVFGNGMYMEWSTSYSDTLRNLGINHDFVVFRGGHNNLILHQEMSVLLFHSAAFSSNRNISQERNLFTGCGNIILDDNAEWFIGKNSSVGIQTNPDNNIDTTNISINIRGDARFTIGTEDVPGGAFQIGDPFTPITLSQQPALENHSIYTTLRVQDRGRIHIGRQGLFGCAVGFEGQERLTQYTPIHTLSSVEEINLDIQDSGALEHNNIASGLDMQSGLIAIGPASEYNLSGNAQNGLPPIVGGGNVVYVDEAQNTHPATPKLSLQREPQPFASEFSPTLYIQPIQDSLDPNATIAEELYQGVMSFQQHNATTENFGGQENLLISATGSKAINPFIRTNGGTSTLHIPASRSVDNIVQSSTLASTPIISDASNTTLSTGSSALNVFQVLQTDPHFSQTSPKASASVQNESVHSTYVIQDVLDVARAGPANSFVVLDDTSNSKNVVKRNTIETILQPPFATQAPLSEISSTGAVSIVINEEGNVISSVTLP